MVAQLDMFTLTSTAKERLNYCIIECFVSKHDIE